MVKDGYEFVEHTADVEYIAHGETLEMCFELSLTALFDTIADIKKLSKSKSKAQTFTIIDNARTLEDLLWFSLQDALSISDAEGLYGYEIKSLKITTTMGEYNINVVVKAKKKERRYSKLDVKGVSQFDMEVTKKKTEYVASVVLDV